MGKRCFGNTQPKGFAERSFFLNGKKFCLRGGEEHRSLKLSEVKRYTQLADHYVYTESSSKSRSGGLQQMGIKNKVVPVYSIPEAGNRCHVMILDTYFSKLPSSAFVNDNFYLQPLPSIPKDDKKPWFGVVPVCRNTLGSMVKDICKEGNIAGNKTNHSLRATGTSSMFEAGVPEKIIQERTGHLSLTGLRQYERTTVEQQRAVCKVLAADTKAAFCASSQAKTTHTTTVTPCPPSQMNFSGCSVVIYQGTQPPLPQPPLPQPLLPQPPLPHPELANFDLDTFMKDL